MQAEVTKYRVSSIAGGGEPLQRLAEYREMRAKVAETLITETPKAYSSPNTIVFGDVVVDVTDDVSETSTSSVGSSIIVEQAVVVAPVVGAVLCVVDTKIGNSLPHTDRNRAVVEKVALQVMRNAGLRPHDISCHISHVVECYFQSRENLEKTGRLRRRAPRWLMRTLGFRESRVDRD